MLQKIIKKALEFGFTDVEIIENYGSETEVNLFKGNIEKNFIGSATDYTLKGLIGTKMASISFQKNNEDLSETEIQNILTTLKNNVLALTTKEEYSIFEGSKTYPEITVKESDLDSVSMEEKINNLKALEKSAYEYSDKIELVDYCRYVEEKSGMRIVNSKGLNLEKKNEYCGYILGVVAGNSDDPNKQNGFEVEIKNTYKELDIAKISENACKEAIDLIGAEPIESKVYPVIIKNKTMASLLSGFQSIFTGEAAIKKLTSLTDKLNEKIMSEKITIVDDPLCELATRRDTFDSEGVATYKKNVVDKGVFKLFLHNLKTAKFFNTSSTGNATVGGVRGMNFHIENGDTDPLDMIASIENGLYVTDLSGLHAGLNPISGDFSAQTQGFLIENGKLTKPVTLVVVSGNFLKMMSDVVSVGNDLKIGYSGVGSPSIQFTGLVVSGK